MMKSLTEGLPPEIAQRIHPDWRKNEAEYWVHRDKLLLQYRDQWIGFANGRVIVSGTSPVEVFHIAHESGQHPFVTCVGHENEPCRMRRAAFAYDAHVSRGALAGGRGRISQARWIAGLGHGACDPRYRRGCQCSAVVRL